MKKKYIISGLALLAAAGVVIYFIKKKSNLPLEAAPNIDLDKYVGEWYEIARMPAPFEKECYSTKATYTKDAEGNIIVENTCTYRSWEAYFNKSF